MFYCELAENEYIIHEEDNASSFFILGITKDISGVIHWNLISNGMIFIGDNNLFE